ncbi:MAG: substrate-binding domain-containing protein, partial [Planctomycetia bacterium]|nr:substrate-binding domain-containing protein [Planctomycetia bacterium]
AAVGKLTRDALQATGQWDALKAKTLVFKATVNDVATDVKLGAVDAGIVWDATIKQIPGLEAVPLPQLAGKQAHMTAGVLTSSTQPTATLRFARYLSARDRGLKHMEQAGFTPVEGDVWAEKPDLRLFSGSMLKVAVENTINAFEQREGVNVTRVYNGCGILVAQMKAGSHPDAYFACEKSFMTQVNDLFVDPVDISSNRLVIVVHKGNPHDVKTLKDLGKPGLRVGVGHEQQCALGAITEQTLKEGGQLANVSKNIKVRTPTGDMLVNQLRTKSLDAVIVYISNAAGLDDIEAFSIEGIPCATAVQPMAVGKNSPHQQLARRLMETLRSAHSQKQFESYGFQWQNSKQ